MKGQKFRITEKYTIGDDPKEITNTYTFQFLEQRLSRSVNIPDLHWGDNRYPGTVYEYEYFGIMECSSGHKSFCCMSEDELIFAENIEVIE